MTSVANEISMPLGIVLRRTPGVTRWARHAWKPVGVLPGAGPAEWRLLREDGEVREYHAATLALELHRTDVEAYKVSLTMEPPAVFVVLRPDDRADAPADVTVHAVTASAYEAQDYLDSGEEIVEAVPMPEGLVAWLRDFVDGHYEETPFVKRKRDRKRVDLAEDGIGDARIRQTADVYRAPGAIKAKAGPH
ncbi:MAG: DUF3305 domain-containing protein [Paracoccaceae bacterium]|nr:DUF3305 domain-containing protein [Paracoccaceae bacterium]